MLKGPKRSFVFLLGGVELCAKHIPNGTKNFRKQKFVTNRTKNLLKGTKNVREQNLFQVEQKMLQKEQKMFTVKIASN